MRRSFPSASIQPKRLAITIHASNHFTDPRMDRSDPRMDRSIHACFLALDTKRKSIRTLKCDEVSRSRPCNRIMRPREGKVDVWDVVSLVASRSRTAVWRIVGATIHPAGRRVRAAATGGRSHVACGASHDPAPPLSLVGDRAIPYRPEHQVIGLVDAARVPCRHRCARQRDPRLVAFVTHPAVG